MSKSDKPLFSHHEHALEKAYEVCPECGSELSIKRGKAGAFWGCENFPNCNYTRAIIEHERVDDQELPGSECPLCQSTLAVKQGRYGMFIGCTNYPECHHIEHEEHAAVADVKCPACHKGNLQERQSRFGKKFYACDGYPKCKFAVNHEPVAGSCQHCGFALLLKRQMASGEKYQCANKKCSEFQT
ncbi:topoisomerase DNA-binding C4 zinc finger domain-containing protein [Thalassotalea sp. PLHSN55]|uniref:DNA topoisomerase family protein n=1 Tax=Thalassotalea sp. PLHSN55 TaxID=3435888 RepID=UPI003F830B02